MESGYSLPKSTPGTQEQRGRLVSFLARTRDCCLVLNKETLVQYLPTLAMVTLLGVTAINVLTSNQSLNGNAEKYKGPRQFLLSMPYTMFLFGFVGLAAAAAVKRRRGVIGCAAGTLLAQLICVVVLGGVVTLVRGEVDRRIVWPVTAVIVVTLVVVWTAMCAYPKFLRDILCCCCSQVKEKADNDICQICGGAMAADGRSSTPAPNPVPDGFVLCKGCGGARVDDSVDLPGIVPV